MAWNPSQPYAAAICRSPSGFDRALDTLQAEALNFGQRFIHDARVRRGYIEETRRYAGMLREEVERGRLSTAQAAQQATDMRNSIMEAARLRSSDIGRASAQTLKANGRSLLELQEHYARRMFNAEFATLRRSQQQRVWKEIVIASGRANPRVSTHSLRLARVGRGLVFVSLAIAVYSISTAERPGLAAAREGATLGAGFAGSVAGGAAAGLVCGPGAPVCVALGAFVGGALFAFGADLSFEWLSR